MDADQRRDAIDEATARIKAQIAAITEAALERAWAITERGLVVGEGRNRLHTDPMGFEAPKQHPVWAEELRHERETMQRMGEVVPSKSTVLERFQDAMSQLPARDRTRGAHQEQGRDGYGR